MFCTPSLPNKVLPPSGLIAKTALTRRSLRLILLVSNALNRHCKILARLKEEISGSGVLQS